MTQTAWQLRRLNCRAYSTNQTKPNKSMDRNEYERQYRKAMRLIGKGNDILSQIEAKMLEARTGIQIVEGCYYQTRSGDRRGPMRRLTPDEREEYPNYEWTDVSSGEIPGCDLWTSDGFYMCDDWHPDNRDLTALSETLP